MFLNESTSGTRFQILLKFKSFVFIIKYYMRNKFNWTAILGCRNVAIVMSLQSFF